MSQKTILSFFKPPQSVTKAVKRTSSEVTSHDSVSKKVCPESKGIHKNVISMEDVNLKQRAEENKWRAKIKLQAKKTPALSTNIRISWFKALENEFQKPYFKELSEKLSHEKSTIYPPADMIYTWTLLCDIENVKVVILGQDPYHGPGQAHGLAFSVPVGKAIPPSLLNIYKEIASDIRGFVIPNHGCLNGWAFQGVLLLNACLTVRAHSANSHKNWGWEQLTDAVIKWISSNLENVVFLLWGAYAQKKGQLINKKKHAVFTAPHPSPFSADRGFFGCRHFSKANDYLKKCGKSQIDWAFLPDE